MVNELTWILAAYFFGALPFSYWIGSAVLQRDIRAVGDGNPGTSNFFKAGGKRYLAWGICVMLLEVCKSMLPVMFGAWYANLEGWSLVALALAPVVGNAFTPFLKFRGGKSIAVILGMWGGLTFFIIPGLLGIFFFVWIKVVKNDAWGMMLGYVSLLLAFLILRSVWFYYPIWFGTFLILLYKWRDGLKQLPDFRQTIFGKIFSRP
jgi:glycerol-3-phosphate acyltransferase PlsY